jgi:hypothetical protein
MVWGERPFIPKTSKIVVFSALPMQVYGPVVLLISVVRIEPSTKDIDIFNAFIS